MGGDAGQGRERRLRETPCRASGLGWPMGRRRVLPRGLRLRRPRRGRRRRAAELLAENSRWEYENLPYWSGEVDCCINAWTVANGLWLGADITGIVDWFVEHRQSDGGWNCDWVEGSTRSSFHSTLNALKGLLAYEAA